MTKPGYCRCGCGQETEVAPRTRASIGWIKGEPKPYARGHQRRRPWHPVDHPGDPTKLLIPLTKRAFATIDRDDLPVVRPHCWYLREAPNGGPYASSATGGLMHRLICGARDGQEVDHVDNDGLNNSRDNLRPATKVLNAGNRKLPEANRTGYKGISMTPAGKWRARLQHRWLGTFETPKEAALVYDAAARKAYGKFARLNFPRPDEMGCRERFSDPTEPTYLQGAAD